MSILENVGKAGKALVGWVPSTSFIGALVAWCSTPSFVGWAGAGKSLLVGAGTSMGASIVAIPGVLGGLLFGGVAGLLTGSKKVAAVAAVGGAIVGGLGGGLYGAIEGYQFSKGALTEGCKTAFNNVTEKSSQTAAYAHLSSVDYSAGAKQLKAMQPAA